MEINKIHNMDCLTGLRGMPDESVDCCVTSPPYWNLRDYESEGQIGREETLEKYTESLVEIFREVRRVLKPDGTFWLNLGDSYSRKSKNILGVPWRTAIALQEDGWILRQDIIWNKPNAMPESVKDRCTKSHEYLFLFTKTGKYYFDSKSIREPNKDKYNGKRGNTKTRKKFQSAMRETSDDGKMRDYSTGGRNQRTVRDEESRIDFISLVSNELECYGIEKEAIEISLFNAFLLGGGSVWNIPTRPFIGQHFATFPQNLIKPCILSGCKPGGVVLDPFMGSGTTAITSLNNGRNFIGFEISEKYIEIAEKRMTEELDA